MSARLAALMVALLLPVASWPTAAWADGYYVDARTGCRLWSALYTANAAVQWNGACRNGLAEGPGIATLTYRTPETGIFETRIEGSYAAGRLQGRALIGYANGQRYEGEMRDGLWQGPGYIVLPGFARLKSNFQGSMKPDGYVEAEFDKDCGRCGWRAGARYVGDFQNGVAQGKGILTLQDGRKYEGEWGNFLPNGKGTYTWDHGTKNYVGKWTSGCSLSPQGTLYSFPDPDVHSCDVMVDYLRTYTNRN